MNLLAFKKSQTGFTLLEIMIVVGIIGILASVIGVNAMESGQRSRDTKRQGDLKTLQTAVELYKSKNGVYPAGCRGANNWSGQQGTSYQCSGSNTQYVVGLAPEFIPVLPVDQKLNGASSGYVYITNVERSVYKIMAMNTVEIPLPATLEAYLHPMKSCDMRAVKQNSGSISSMSGSWCATPPIISPNHCLYTDSLFQHSFAVWGGFAQCTGNCSDAAGNSTKALTTTITCKI